MATQNNPIYGSEVGGPAVMPASMGSVTNDYAAWLEQATKVRNKAFGFLQDRFIKDIDEAAQFVGRIDPNALALQMEYATKLTADYLAESERLFELMSRLAQNGRLEARQDGCGHRIGNTEEQA
jgi:hypothetical protein